MRAQWGVCGVVVALGIALGACGGGGGGGGDEEEAQGGPGLFGVVGDLSGAPIEGARVIVGGASARTDARGEYSLGAPAGEAVVRVEAPGFLPQIKRLRLGEAPTAWSARLLAEAASAPLDAGAGGAVEGARGARVEVGGGALVDPQGASVSGEVEVSLTPLDPSVRGELAAAPGGLDAVGAGGEAIKLESFGMMDITIRQDGQELQLGEGQVMQIRIPAPAGVSSPPAEVPLWSFDEAAGVWRQEGALRLDAEAGVYAGEISHMSFWNADQEQETTCVTGTVVDEATGAPLAGAAVVAVGQDYTGTDSAITDAQGRFVVLVRVDSEVELTAYHAADGEEARTLRAGSRRARQPARLDDDACEDGGEWRVKRGSPRPPQAPPAFCDASVFEEFEGCLPTFQRLFVCHNPQGSCETAGGNPLSGFGYRFENGARAETDFDIEAGEVTTSYYGPGGELCGSQVISGSTGGIVIRLANGEESMFSATQGGNGDITYTCEDGSRRTLSAERQELLQLCSGGEGCEEGEGGGDLLGQECEGHEECGELYCCIGYCQPQSLCFVPVCKGDEDCGDGFYCCESEFINAGAPICQDYVSCNGSCREDGDCQDGALCCEGECVNDGRPYCEGYCRDSGDCPGDSGEEYTFCCERPGELNSCWTDEISCLTALTCASDGDCGSEGGLVCCDQEGSLSCQTPKDCYANQPCDGEGQCQGGLVCCQRPDFGEEGSCQTEYDCALLAPCGGDGECVGDQVCCRREEFGEVALCAPADSCFVQRACTSDAECGPLRCCDPGVGAQQCWPEELCP